MLIFLIEVSLSKEGSLLPLPVIELTRLIVVLVDLVGVDIVDLRDSAGSEITSSHKPHGSSPVTGYITCRRLSKIRLFGCPSFSHALINEMNSNYKANEYISQCKIVVKNGCISDY